MTIPKPHINHKLKELSLAAYGIPLVKMPASSRVLSESQGREVLKLKMNLASEVRTSTELAKKGIGHGDQRNVT